MRRRRIAWILALGVLLGGCGSPLGVEPDELPMLQILDGAGVREREGVPRLWVLWVFENRTNRTLWLRTHCGVLLQQRDGTEWETVWGGECLASEQSVIWLASGEPYLDELDVAVGEDWTSGEYRLMLTRLSDELLPRDRLGEPVPLELRVSPPFEVAIPGG